MSGLNTFSVKYFETVFAFRDHFSRRTDENVPEDFITTLTRAEGPLESADHVLQLARDLRELADSHQSTHPVFVHGSNMSLILA